MGTSQILIIVLVLTVLAIGGFFVYQNLGAPSSQEQEEVAGDTTEPISQIEEESLGEELYEGVQNPGEQIPETNLFEKEVNPLEAETNPFSGGYQNPF